ncbi:hypothetical protein BGZ59_003091, partial [Podila verticillata]
MNPSGAVGAIAVIHDAVTLANWISTLSLPTAPELEAVFEEHQPSFLPEIEDKARLKRLYQPSLHKNREIRAELAKTKKVSTIDSKRVVA